MSMLLITSHMPMNDERWKVLRDALPEVEMVYCKDAPPTPEEFARADFILGIPDPASLVHCKNLKLLQCRSAGADKYTPKGVLPKGAVLATSNGAFGQSVAETMTGVLLLMMKHLDVYSRNMPGHIWEDAGPARTIVDSRVLIIGMGDIGTEFANRMKSLGAYVIGIRRTGLDKPESVDELYHQDKIDEILPSVDTVALFVPGTAETKHIMSRERLALMKDNAYIINAGRGTAIDQEALCDALESGKFAGAGLDVTVPEPLPAENRLWNAPRLFITPHVAGTDHLTVTADKIIKNAAHNIAAFISGGKLNNEIDCELGYRILR